MAVVVVVVEVEHVKQIADGGHVRWDVGVLRVHVRIGEIVAAAARSIVRRCQFRSMNFTIET